MYSSSNPIMQHITRTVSERWNKDQGLKYILYGHLSGANIHYSWYSALWKALAIWASYLTLFHYYWSNGSNFFGWKPVWPVEEQVLFLARETNSTFAHKAKKQKFCKGTFLSPLSGFGCWASDSVFPSPDLSSGLSPFIQKNHANQQKNI